MIRVGCCGYPVGRKKYMEVFRLVELNTTFYNYPRTSTVVRWREEASEDFEFTVKAHQDISHKHMLKLEQAREPLERMKEICRILNAETLLVQTPASFKPDNLKDAEEFFEGTDHEGLTLVWETRGSPWEGTEIRDKLRNVLERLDVPHVTDPLKVMPVYTGHVAYFRLHGLGERMYYYQYTDKELLKLYDLVKPLDTADREVYVLFNNLSMFEDAKRFQSYIKRGRFPSLTGVTGLDLVKVLISKMRYPSTKTLLIRKLGWRLVELEDGRQVRLEELLRNLSSKTYKNTEEVLKEIRL